jgi:drug/metabolite transporter (DMT)-like permease
MHYLLLAIITSSACAITIKLFGRYKIDSFHAIWFNYIVCIILSQIFYSGGNRILIIKTGDILQGGQWGLLAVMLGFGFIAMFNIFAISTKKIGIALSTVSGKMSVIVPVYFGTVLYGDSINAYKISGIILTILAFYFIFKKEKDIKFRRLYFFLPLLLFAGNGFNDTIQTYCQRAYRMDSNATLQFMTMIYLTAFTTGSFISLYRRIFLRYEFNARNLAAGIILGIVNFTTTFYFLKSVGYYESTFVFPVFNVSIVGITALAGVVFFREKLSAINWLGFALAALAIIVIAIG